jgi:hypothetical protein
MTGRPAIEPPGTNSLLLLDVGQPDSVLAEGLPSRVEGVEAGDLLVAAPGFKGDLHAVVAGLPVRVRWTGPRGLHSLDTSLVSVLRGSVTTWRVQPRGPVQVLQRRSYARAPLCTPIALVPVDESLARVTTGWLIDISEGGLRVGVDGPTFPTGTVFEAWVELDGMPVALVGTVLRTEQRGAACDRHEIVVLIDAGRHADLIRRVVLRQQRLARRGGGA